MKNEETKRYIKMFYPGEVFFNVIIKETGQISILDIKTDKKATGFQFVDVIETRTNNGILKEEIEGDLIYFGKRYSTKEIIEMYTNDPNKKVFIDRLKESKIKYICKCDNDTFQVLHDGNMTYEEALIKLKEESLKQQFQIMFNKLKKHIGKDITCDFWTYGVKQQNNSKLKKVNDFYNVLVDGASIPFIGYGTAISNITSTDGKQLYYNPFIEPHYDRREKKDIYNVQKESFGESIAYKSVYLNQRDNLGHTKTKKR